jgi:hypothetical protein
LSAYREGTLILQNVDELEAPDAHRLLEWCEHNQPRSRIIATTSRQTVLAEHEVFRNGLHRLKLAQLLLI